MPHSSLYTTPKGDFDLYSPAELLVFEVLKYRHKFYWYMRLQPKEVSIAFYNHRVNHGE